MYGPPFRPRIPAEAISTRSKDAYPGRHPRRPGNLAAVGLRLHQAVGANPFAETFDAPDSTATCGRRNTTAVPTQNLALLNDPFVRDCAADLARRVVAESGPDPSAAIRRAYELALGRPPRDDEQAAALAFLDCGRRPGSPSPTFATCSSPSTNSSTLIERVPTTATDHG